MALTIKELNAIRKSTADTASIACAAYAANRNSANHAAANDAGVARRDAHDAYFEAMWEDAQQQEVVTVNGIGC
jgi:hypothetical protein